MPQNTEHILYELKLVNTKNYKPQGQETSSLIQLIYC